MVYDPNKFKSASPVLVNYDFVDIASGTGYEDFYLIKSEDSTGANYHLTQRVSYSSDVCLTQSPAGTKDIDFDLTPFNFPRTINGDVLISIPIYTTVTYSLTCYLYKYDGSTETELGNVGTGSIVGTGANMKYFVLPIDNVLIPAGEVLRLRVVLTMFSNGTIHMGIDPAARTDGNLTITTQSKISIPFKLDL